MNRPTFLAAAMLMVSAAGAGAQTAAPDDMGRSAGPAPKRVRITYENLTAGQVFSPAAFWSHNAAAPALWEEGRPAPFALQRIAEEGNPGPLLSGRVTKTLGGAFGSSIAAVSVQPGKTRSVELQVDRDHPMVSGAWMLVMTNDGFTGVQNVDAYALTRPVTMDLYAYDAGTERNSERGQYLVALEGSDRDPENGVVRRHSGIRGDADAPGAWKFDPARPVGRITVEPAR